MLFHVLCYLEQNEENEHNEKSCQSLGNNKMADHNDSVTVTNSKSFAEPEKKPEVSYQSTYGKIVFFGGDFNNSDHSHSAYFQYRGEQKRALNLVLYLLGAPLSLLGVYIGVLLGLERERNSPFNRIESTRNFLIRFNS